MFRSVIVVEHRATVISYPAYVLQIAIIIKTIENDFPQPYPPHKKKYAISLNAKGAETICRWCINGFISSAFLIFFIADFNIFSRLSNGNDEMLVSTRKGKCIRFNERHVRNVGRNSIGVRSMRIAEGDEVIDIAAVEPDTTVLTITTKGYGKRTDPEEYREQGRGGMGIKAMQLTEKTGDLTAMLFVHEDEDILLITDDGTIIRARAADVRLCGRSTQGVRIMRLAGESMVVGVCRAEKEEEPLPDDVEVADGSQAEEGPAEGEQRPAVPPEDVR